MGCVGSLGASSRSCEPGKVCAEYGIDPGPVGAPGGCGAPPGDRQIPFVSWRRCWNSGRRGLTAEPAWKTKNTKPTRRRSRSIWTQEYTELSPEIGAGQEVARCFFHVGGAAGTIAKTISAYDMRVSDAIYGPSDRYVSRNRLQAMLDYEFNLILERLNANRGDKIPLLRVCRHRGHPQLHAA